MLTHIFRHFSRVRPGGDPMKKAFDQAPGSCVDFRHSIIGDYTCVRVRRLRSEPPSQRDGRMRLGRSKSRLVPEKNRPSSHAYAQWDIALLSLRRLPWLTGSRPQFPGGAEVSLGARRASALRVRDCRNTRPSQRGRRPLGASRCDHSAAMAASLATVFMLRAVPSLATGMRNLERPIPSG